MKKTFSQGSPKSRSRAAGKSFTMSNTHNNLELEFEDHSRESLNDTSGDRKNRTIDIIDCTRAREPLHHFEDTHSKFSKTISGVNSHNFNMNKKSYYIPA